MKNTLPAPLPAKDTAAFRASLLAWYADHARAMPWRQTQNPYHIWLAEVMLQQTTVATVIPYYRRFLAAFPTVADLAAADIQSVLHLWQGLGYYRRAHQLHACAQVIATRHHGQFPATVEGLLALPGIGPYTANAIAATAFNVPASVVDGNVERVIARLFRIATPLPLAKKHITLLAGSLADPANSRLYANAIMELGATLCTPANPACLVCPVHAHCAAFKAGDPAGYPVKAPKKKTPSYQGNVYLVTDSHGHLYLRQRPATGLLAALWEYPHDGWEKTALPPELASLDFLDTGKTITHTFTHFKLRLHIHTATTTQPHPKGLGFSKEDLPPIPTLMAKIFPGR